MKDPRCLYLIPAAIILLALPLACNIPALQSNAGIYVSSDSTERPPVVRTKTIKATDGTTTPTGETPQMTVTGAAGIAGTTPTMMITRLTVTDESGAAAITATEDTNCRKGPGVMYEIVGKLLIGQTSEVVAKYQNGKFWLIRNPTNPAVECWVWDQTTRVTGNTASLPEVTPPATPQVTLSLTIYAVISPITYSGTCPVVVDLIGNYTINTPAIINYQWTIGDLLVSSGAVTAGATGTYSSSNQITITSTTTNPIRLKASAPPKTVTTSPIGFNIVCI